ncbi:MAG: MFS transporter [Prevotellaceae bacterium]|nr:MFS transporter [Prevotellaceae bacterium]
MSKEKKTNSNNSASLKANPIKNLSDSKGARWSALFIVAFTMMAAYYVNDVMAPLKSMLEEQLHWTSGEFGFFTGAYSFLNVFLLMLIWGGLILDKFGIRFTGILSTVLMVAGTATEYIAITQYANSSEVIMGYKLDVFMASAGYSVFGVGAEVAGITVTKIIAKWFQGKEMALAMGVQVALARIGSQAAYAVAIPVAKAWNLDTPLFFGAIVLVGGLVAFLAFSFMDRKLDKQIKTSNVASDEDKFSFKDVAAVVKNPGFWLIALLCVLFYSCVFPFQKFATELMVTKYSVDEDLAGTFAGLPALGALFLTPLFGGMIDKKGKAASIMMLGAAMLIGVHLVYSLPFIHSPFIAIGLMIILGIAFSLVPSAMWPSVAKIFPVKQLGTAYALIFFIQNIGLWGIPALIGLVLEKYCIVGAEGEKNIYDYTLPMIIFTGIACLSLLVAFLLKAADKKYGYKLEEANIKN